MQGINISGTQGDVIGACVSGGHIIGKNIVVGDGTINVSDQRLTQIQNNEYAESLKQFSETINNQLKGRQVPEEKVKSINQSINELAEEVKDLKPGKEQEIDYVKQTNVEAKTASIIQKSIRCSPPNSRNSSYIYTTSSVQQIDWQRSSRNS